MNGKMVKLATVLFFLIGFGFTSTSALSYWREVTVSRDVELVTIGEPVEILIDDLNQTEEIKQLVPFGYVFTVDQTSEITLEYEVGVSKELLNAVDLYIRVDDIMINDDDTYSHLVDIKVLGSKEEIKLDLYNSTILVTVVVTLIEPIDENEAIELGLDTGLVNVLNSVEAYNDIAGKDITFTLSFELETKEPVIEEPITETTN